MTASDRAEEVLICVGLKLQSGHCADNAGIEGVVKESESHHLVVHVKDGMKESNGHAGFRERRVRCAMSSLVTKMIRRIARITS
jgi:hypothetical protein